MSERLGLHSASGLEADMLCPGRHRQCAGMPSPSGPDAERGNRVHLALLHGEESDAWKALTAEELDTAERCQKLATEAVKSWHDGSPTTMIEPARMFLRDGIKPIFSGETDVLITQGRRALVLDFKSGFGEQTESSSNPQLMGYAVLVNENYGPFDSVTVGLIQPLVGGPVELCAYSAPALRVAEKEIIRTIQRSNDPAAPLVPGLKQCNFCPAKLKCPAANKVLEVMANTQLVPADSQTALTFTGKDLAEFQERCNLAARIAEKGKAWVQAVVLANPEKFPEFAIEDSKGRETITKLETVLARMTPYGVTQEAFLQCLVPRKDDSKTSGAPGLKGVLGRAAGLKGMPLKNALEGVLEGCTTAGTVKKKAVLIGSTIEGNDE